MKMIRLDHQINHMQKRARAEAIAGHLEAVGQTQCVCLSCGNASKALKEAGIQTLSIIKPQRWYTFAEVQVEYTLFDATSGHLPIPVMHQVAFQLGSTIGRSKYWKGLFDKALKEGTILTVPTGSGETLVTLKMIYPMLKVVPAYNLDASTQFHPRAPLNSLVLALAHEGQILDYNDEAILERVKKNLGL